MQIETISIRALGEYVILEVEIDGQTKELCRERLDAAFSHAVNVANFKPAQQPEPSSDFRYPDRRCTPPEQSEVCETDFEDAEAIAKFFHYTYERLAPDFGYETRPDTKQFDAESPNGKLMIAVCGEFLAGIRKPASPAASEPSRDAMVELINNEWVKYINDTGGRKVEEWFADFCLDQLAHFAGQRAEVAHEHNALCTIAYDDGQRAERERIAKELLEMRPASESLNAFAHKVWDYTDRLPIPHYQPKTAKDNDNER